MKKVCFFSWPIYSHVKSSIQIIEALSKNNIEIYYFSSINFKYLLDNKKINFVEYNMDINFRTFSMRNENYKKFHDIHISKKIVNLSQFKKYVYNRCQYLVKYQKLFYKNNIQNIKNINPDFIINDACCYFAKMLSLDLNIPYTSYITNILFDENYFSTDTRNKLSIAYGIDLDSLSNYTDNELFSIVKTIQEIVSIENNVPTYPFLSPYDSGNSNTIIFSSNLLQPKIKDNKYLCKHNSFKYKQNITIEKDINLIYISTGSFLVADIGFYNAVINAYKDTKYSVIMTIPKLDMIYLKNLPKNTTISKQVDQNEVLLKASLFITHAGYNSLCESIYHKVPMLAYPISNDQFLNTDIIVKEGLGVNLKNISLSKNNILKLTDYLINNTLIHENLTKHSLNMSNTPNIDAVFPNILNDIL